MKPVAKSVFFAIFIISLGFSACNNSGKGVSTDLVTNASTANDPNKTGDVAAMSFDKTAHDFGPINQGMTVSYSFNFTNTGKAPLVITEAHSTCGCTVPTYPHDPVQPGQQGTIEVTFNSKNKNGAIKKTVTIIANTKPAENYVYITADVKLPQ